MAFCGSIFDADGDHPARGEVLALGIEMRRRSAPPAAAEEKYDGRCFVAWLVSLGLEDMQFEFNFSPVFSSDGLVRYFLVRFNPLLFGSHLDLLDEPLCQAQYRMRVCLRTDRTPTAMCMRKGIQIVVQPGVMFG